MRLIATTKQEIQARLYEFLGSAIHGTPRVSGVILAGHRELLPLFREPDPQIVQMLRLAFSRLWCEISSNPRDAIRTVANPPKISVSVLGLAVAAHNAVSPLAPGSVGLSQAQRQLSELVDSFTRELLATVPVAASLPEMVLYHSLLRDIIPSPQDWPRELSQTVEQLVSKSPLTSLVALDGYQNPALQPLAEELLGTASKQADPITISSDWHAAVERIAEHPELVGWLRRQWLDLPETRRSCRHLGLILETLRRQGNRRALLLEFYEAYERSRCPVAVGGGTSRSVFAVLAELLQAPGSSDAAVRLNRWGNEYLLKFLPLVEIVTEERGVPKDYQHLTMNFAGAISQLLKYMPSNMRHQIVFTPVDVATRGKT